MAGDLNQANYTVKAAAVRVGRSERTIRRWIRDGLTCREVAGIVVIDHAVLLARFRKQIIANPTTRQNKMHDVIPLR